MPRKKSPSAAPSTDLFCGLDLSLTSTGIVVINKQGTVIHKAVLKNKLRGMERLHFIRNEIVELYRKHSITFTCLEGYSMGSKGGRAFDIGELGGVIKLFLYQRKMDYHLVPPPQVKKYAAKVGNCDKNKVMLAVFKEWGFEGQDDNMVDGYVLSQIARAVIHTIPIRAHQTDIIIQIRRDRKEKQL